MRSASEKLLGAVGHDHEFLHVDGIIRVRAAVEDVHHRHRQRAGVDAAQIAIERGSLRCGGGARHGHGNGQHRVRAEIALVRRAVEIDHDLVDLRLQRGVVTDQRFRDRPVDVGDGFGRALAQIAMLIAIAQFDGFMLAGGSAARNGGAAVAAIGQKNFGLNGGVSTRIQNLDSADSDDC